MIESIKPGILMQWKLDIPNWITMNGMIVMIMEIMTHSYFWIFSQWGQLYLIYLIEALS